MACALAWRRRSEGSGAPPTNARAIWASGHPEDLAAVPSHSSAGPSRPSAYEIRPLATAAKLLGIGGASSGAAASAGAGGSAAVAGGATAATATATKVVAIVCCAAVVGGGAAEVREHVSTVAPTRPAAGHVRTVTARAGAPVKAPVARADDPVRDLKRERVGVSANYSF